MRARLVTVALVLLFPAGPASAGGEARVAALQGVLEARGLYVGPIDGVRGSGTLAAIRAAQRQARIAVDGIAGPVTRRALQLRELGSRPLALGASGPDVLELQWALAAHGFPSGVLDGLLGPHTAAALHRYQRWAGLSADWIAGPQTVRALRRPPPRSPRRLAWPLIGPLGDRFGPRGRRFHAGLDILAPTGQRVVAAGPGRVTYAGFRDGWGLEVTVAHGDGVRTMYAHLSRVEVHVGQRVRTGFQLGRVGATGEATGPHLHFEVRVRGAAVDPLSALP